LLDAMSGTPRLMATLIYGGGLRVSECCELRIKDLDFDQGLVLIRCGKGDKDRSTLLAEIGREELRAHPLFAEANEPSMNVFSQSSHPRASSCPEEGAPHPQPRAVLVPSSTPKQPFERHVLSCSCWCTTIVGAS
jgi:Phage integrase family